MAGQTISVGTADDMISDYNDYMTNLGVNMEKQTQSVSFTASAVMEWLSQVMGSADELRVFIGLYPPEHEKAGRTTIILWPYLNDQPLENTDPFNDGMGQP
jgi:hypothetical protein